MAMERDIDLSSLAKRFGVVDYVVFASVLVVSAAIGVYFGCTGGKQKTTGEFLLADRSMSVVPVALSLLASFMSAIAIIGMPAEFYTYGTIYCWMALAYLCTVYIGAYVYIPVFYRLKVTSAFEYLEKRFSKPVQVATCVCYILQMCVYLAIAMYAPSLALSSVTGINVWVSVLSIAVVVTFYTTLGGMKAVLWTDTFQVFIMFAGMLAVVIKGTMDQGVSTIYKNAVESGRLDVFDWSKLFNPNPLERHTFFSVVIGGTVYWCYVYGVNQAQVQRALAVPTLKKAQLAYWLNLPGLLFIIFMGAAAGLIIYSHFKDCDPLKTGLISAQDQLYPLYVMEVLGDLTGMPGLIVASAFSGALSTVSSGLNSLAAVTLSDIVKSIWKTEMTESRATLVTKIIALSYGILAVALTFVVSKFGMILQAAQVMFGILGGPTLAVFTLGMFFPWVNSHGALAGLISSLIMTSWLGFGGMIASPYVYKFPTSIEGCPQNSSLYGNETFANANWVNVTVTPTQSVEELIAESRSGLNGFYSISYLYIMSLACMVCTTVALIVSAITGFNDPAELDGRLISPVFDKFCCCLPERWRLKCHCGVNHEDDEEEDDDDINTMRMKERKI